jgi:L-asparaginase II
MSAANPILVEVTRGDRVESRHRGAIAVCDANGGVVAAWGDVEAPTFPRSAFKALQALPLIESGAADAFAVGEEELALACASHSGEAMHVERVERWLTRIGCREGDLACGPHLPLHEATAHAMLRAGDRPCRLHNNCSGKHTGFLTLARHLDVSVAGYERIDHPIQVMVREAIAELCDRNPRELPVGIDGCAAPNYAIPLASLARAMARLGDRASLGAKRAAAAKRILEAWKNHPRLVSGTGRACTDLIEAASGKTVVKTGAEGVYTAVVPEKGLGVALKIDDGATRAAETAMARILELLGAADVSSPLLAKHLRPAVRNWRGDIVGERTAAPALDRLMR